jgi:hypothetical protein
LLANAAAAPIGSDAHVLDQAARGALRAQARQDAELQAADDAPTLLRHHELDVRIAAQPFERIIIERVQRIFEPLAGTAEMIVGEHGDDRSDIVAAGGSNSNWRGRGHVHCR